MVFINHHLSRFIENNLVSNKRSGKYLAMILTVLEKCFLWRYEEKKNPAVARLIQQEKLHI
jgi:hypothetical protein